MKESSEVGTFDFKEQDFVSQPILLFSLKFYDRIVVLFEDGTLLKFSFEAEHKSTELLNGIREGTAVVAAKMSPIEETLAVVFSDNRLATYSKTFQLEKETQLDSQKTLSADINWRLDSRCFSVNYELESGRKAVTYSNSLDKIQSKSLFNPEYELVTNVFEKADLRLRELNVWATNGSAVYGVQTTQNGADNNLVCWEANGLIYKSFQIPEALRVVRGVSQIVFNPTSEIMALVSQQPKPAIYLCFRSNADWFLKTQTDIPFANPEIVSFERQMIVKTDESIVVLNYALTNDLFEYIDRQ